MSWEDRITEEVRGLSSLDLEGLREVWRRRYGPPPKLRSPALLARLLAWRIQAEAFGDGGPALRRLIAAPARLDGKHGPVLPMGAEIRRHWRGVTYVLRVVPGGFELSGRTFSSLSKAAKEITGVKWNGPRFFGLRDT